MKKLLGIFAMAAALSLRTPIETTEIKTETDYVYVICDVLANYDTNVTNLVCKMPNGEHHIYEIEDAPEGKIELVCFRTENQDDYTVYEVVAVR